MKKKTENHTTIFAFQQPLRPVPPVISGPKEYRDFCAIVIEMDRILNSGIEHNFIINKMEVNQDLSLSIKKFQRVYTGLRKAFRESLLLGFTSSAKREMAIRISDSIIFNWFTATNAFDPAKTSKSSIDRYEKRFTDDEIADLIDKLNQAVSDKAQAQRLILEDELDFSRHWADSTCIKADIHFPVDWVLLRDATRSLIQSIEVIRNHGLKYRIGDPRDFIRKMNALVMQMTHTGKKKNAPTRRKMILRRMKKLLKLVESHGQRYYDLLDNHWPESDLSYNQAQVILDQMQNILSQIPLAIDQAEERIIREKKVNNAEKILSLYDDDVHVLIRGKSGAQVEFGSGLYLAENEDGLITDWQFFQDQPPADSTLVAGSLERLKERYGLIRSYTGDRGFYSADNSRILEEEGIYNAISPKPVRELETRLKERDFVRLQKRRAGTEARIGILKNNFIGKPLRSKRFGHRKRRIGWSILSHNLWVLASIAAENRSEEQEPFQDVS